MIYSNTEFYYTNPKNISDFQIIIKNEEAKHLLQVMRHKIGDIINITDGIGNVFEAKIIECKKNIVQLEYLRKSAQIEKFPNIYFYIPILKSSDRLEFALEKSVELGITNFVIYSSDNSAKRGIKKERWEKISISAMKQSLHTHKPKIEYQNELTLERFKNSRIIVFDQLAKEHFMKCIVNLSSDLKVILLFGPEAGFSSAEINRLSDAQSVYLTRNRLRTETAIVSAASCLN